MAALSSPTRRQFLLIGLALATARPGLAVPAPAMEVKAVFTYNFINFVKWPEAAFESPTSPLVIGVSGDPEMARLMTKVVNGQRWGERAIQVVEVKTVEQAAPCHLLYVAPGAEGLMRKVLAARPVLTVGETDGFLAAGGMIRLLTDRNRVKVQVNLAATKARGLEVSSQLLRIAQVIGGGP